MQNESKINAINETIADLRYIETMSASGVSNHNIRHMIGQLRKICEGGLTESWGLAGFKGRPKILAWYLNTKLITNSEEVIIAGAVDHNPEYDYSTILNPTEEDYREEASRHPQFRTMLLVESEKGLELLRSPSNLTYTITSTGSMRGLENSDKYITLQENAFNQYIESTAVFSHGKKISRDMVVRYIAHARNGVHPTNLYKPTPKQKETSIVLDKLSQEKNHFRDTLFYIAQSIAQDIVKSPDVMKLMEWTPVNP